MDLVAWLTIVGIIVAGLAVVVAHRQLKIEADRRHEELAPVWETPRFKAVGEGPSWRLELTLARGLLDDLVLEIHDSPGITFDTVRQPGATADRLERNATMHPGSSTYFWIRVNRSHEGRFRLRATASLQGKAWNPDLLPEVSVVHGLGE
ncbi:hypothetical protein [Nocardia sp. XZ_19_369]|uniref:hypothetical protein n=1 Tax=Nocardia sp. XZ_19_369 TaxID=2769487 RepID=UPI00188EAB11|nr:hypothetical protein [Nocardia sp. XZ_19_369]